MQASTEKPVAESGDQAAAAAAADKDTIPTPRFLRSPVNPKFIQPNGKDFKSWKFILTSSLLHKRFRVKEKVQDGGMFLF